MSDDATAAALPPQGIDAIRARHLARRAAAAAAPPEVTAVDNDTGEEIHGEIVPRLWTPPLRELTPDTSYGYDLIDFARQIGWPLDPWQEWLAIHMGELLPDGRPRFRFCLILVARQNGKTIFCQILTLYWMLVERHPLIIGTSTARDTAKSSWRAVMEFAQNNPGISHRFTKPRETIGEEAFTTTSCTRRCEIDHEHEGRSVYRFAAPNRRAGRSKTVNRAILDELREHQTWDTYDALINAMNAVGDAQAVAITNQGDTESIVLDSIRTDAVDYIETGRGTGDLFLAEWSAPTGSKPTDPRALAQANPDLGNRLKLHAIMGQATGAENAGGERAARFKTEVMCMRVPLLDPAIDPDSYAACGIAREDFPNLADHRRAVALVLDISLDLTHATLAAAAEIDGHVYGEAVMAWQGPDCTRLVREELPALLSKIRPRAFGWFPEGPAAALVTTLRKRRGVRSVTPRGTRTEEIRGELAAVCMGFGRLVQDGIYRHHRDPMIKAHVERTQKLSRGDTWTFTRAGTEPVDGTYAQAGAAHLCQIVPKGRALAVVDDD